MRTTKIEYEKRKKEVGKYIEAVQWLDKGDCKIICTDILGKQLSMQIDEELSKILKANCFILLYNLMESTIANSIKAVINSIENEHLTYGQLSEQIKRLWIRQATRKIKDKNQPGNIIKDIAESVLNRQLLTLQKDCVSISGNIDAQEIRSIAKQIGWEESKDGRDLATVKNKRNSLAHGEFTFSDIGKDYTINELTTIKDNTLSYLDDVLDKVESYIKSQKYKLNDRD